MRRHGDLYAQVAGAAALGAGAALPARTMSVCPSAMPAGTSTFTVRVARVRPVPRQVSQGSRTMLPWPRHTLQVLVRMNCPKPPMLADLAHAAAAVALRAGLAARARAGAAAAAGLAGDVGA